MGGGLVALAGLILGISCATGRPLASVICCCCRSAGATTSSAYTQFKPGSAEASRAAARLGEAFSYRAESGTERLNLLRSGGSAR